MQLARARIVIDRLGNDNQRMNVTPAEAQLLQVIHKVNVTGTIVNDIRITGDDKERTPLQEKQRLMAIYGGAMNRNGSPVIEDVFPGEYPKLPETFKEVGLAQEKPVAAAA